MSYLISRKPLGLIKKIGLIRGSEEEKSVFDAINLAFGSTLFASAALAGSFPGEVKGVDLLDTAVAHQ